MRLKLILSIFQYSSGTREEKLSKILGLYKYISEFLKLRFADQNVTYNLLPEQKRISMKTTNVKHNLS